MDTESFVKALGAGDRGVVGEALKEDPGLANVRTSDGATALQAAVYYGGREMVEDLLKAGAAVDFASACTIGMLDAIPADVDVNAMSPDGFRPLALAVAFGNNDVARLLLQKGANPDLPSTALGGVAPVHAAVFGRNMEGLQLVVDAAADVNARQHHGFTALMGAAQNGDLPMVRYLLDHGASPNLVDDDGKVAADWATTDEIRFGLVNGF